MPCSKFPRTFSRIRPSFLAVNKKAVLFWLRLDRREQHLVLEDGVDAVEQFFFAERLDEVCRNPGIEGTLTNGIVRIGRYHRGDWIAGGDQLAVQLAGFGLIVNTRGGLGAQV